MVDKKLQDGKRQAIGMCLHDVARAWPLPTTSTWHQQALASNLACKSSRLSSFKLSAAMLCVSPPPRRGDELIIVSTQPDAFLPDTTDSLAKVADMGSESAEEASKEATKVSLLLSPMAFSLSGQRGGALAATIDGPARSPQCAHIPFRVLYRTTTLAGTAWRQ